MRTSESLMVDLEDDFTPSNAPAMISETREPRLSFGFEGLMVTYAMRIDSTQFATLLDPPPALGGGTACEGAGK